jgi:hypothetical protein
MRRKGEQELRQPVIEKRQSYFDTMRHTIAIGIAQQFFHSIHQGIIVQDTVEVADRRYIIIRDAGLPDKIPGEVLVVELKGSPSFFLVTLRIYWQ